MILRCIDNNLCSSLTLNKEYYVIEETSDYYVVIDDLKNETTCRKSRFVIVEDNDLLKNTQEVLVASVDDIAMKIVEIEQNRDIQKKLAEKNMQFIKMYDNSIVYEQISEIYKKELVR